MLYNFGDISQDTLLCNSIVIISEIERESEREKTETMSRFSVIFILLTLLVAQGFHPSLCDDEENEIGSCLLTPNVTVSREGNGDFKKIAEAVASVPNNNKIRFIIFVKEGVYYENVVVPRRKNKVLIYGEGMTKTVISSNLSRLEFPKSTTVATATFCK